LRPDGEKKWEFAAGAPITSSPAPNVDVCVYFSSVDGFIYAVNLDGTLRWRLRTGGITTSSPTIGPDGIIYICVNQHLWAIKPDGQKKWERGVEGAMESSPVVLEDDSTICISGWGLMLNMDPERTVKWWVFLNGHGGATPAISPAGIVYVPDSAFYFSAYHGTVPLAKTPWPKFRGNLRNTGNAADHS